MKNSTAVEKGIYQRGPFSFQVKLMVDGHLITGTFDTLEEAQAYRNSKRASLSLDHDAKRLLKNRVSRLEVKSATLFKMLERYKKEVTSKKKSITTEGHKISKIMRSDLAHVSIYRITPDDISSYLSGLTRDPEGPCNGQPLSESTKRKYAALLSHLYTIARKRWRMDVVNPVADIELPSPGKSRKRRLENGEEEKLLAALAKSRQSKIVVPMVRLAIETAMRQGELLSLEWKNIKINNDHGTALLQETKNGEQRIVPLNTQACLIINSMVRPLKGGQLFPIKQQALRVIWEFACDRAGIEDLRFHDLRHEATSRLFELGLDRVEAASITGHKTLQMLKDYTHLRAEKLAQKMNAAQISTNNLAK